MVKKIAIALLALVAGFGVFVSLQPAQYSVARSLVVAAPPAVVFPHINDFEKWHEWSPWSQLDADMTVTYGDKKAGEGAVYEWSGNDDVGSGRMAITKSVANERVVQDLAFLTPFESHADTELILAPEAAGTKVTWKMTGTNDFMGKIFGLMVDMDTMVGADYEKGLNNLKAIVEPEAHERAADLAKVEEAMKNAQDAHAAGGDAAAAKALIEAARAKALEAARDPNRVEVEASH